MEPVFSLLPYLGFRMLSENGDTYWTHTLVDNQRRVHLAYACISTPHDVVHEGCAHITTTSLVSSLSSFRRLCFLVVGLLFCVDYHSFTSTLCLYLFLFYFSTAGFDPVSFAVYVDSCRLPSPFSSPTPHSQALLRCLSLLVSRRTNTERRRVSMCFFMSRFSILSSSPHDPSPLFFLRFPCSFPTFILYIPLYFFHHHHHHHRFDLCSLHMHSL